MIMPLNVSKDDFQLWIQYLCWYQYDCCKPEVLTSTCCSSKRSDSFFREMKNVRLQGEPVVTKLPHPIACHWYRSKNTVISFPEKMTPSFGRPRRSCCLSRWMWVVSFSDFEKARLYPYPWPRSHRISTSTTLLRGRTSLTLSSLQDLRMALAFHLNLSLGSWGEGHHGAIVGSRWHRWQRFKQSCIETVKKNAIIGETTQSTSSPVPLRIWDDRYLLLRLEFIDPSLICLLVDGYLTKIDS